jgi:hypothetical protein
MTLYYVARQSDYQNTMLYVAGPFGAYHQACDAKDNSTFSSEYLRIVEQTIEVNE